MDLELKEKISGIKVIPLNMDKISADIDSYIKNEIAKANGSTFAPSVKENEEFVVFNRYAHIVGTNMLVDSECIAELIEGDLQTAEVTFDVYSQIRENNKVTSWEMMPRFTTKQIFGELFKEYGQPEIPLSEFLGENVGRRVCSNIGIIFDEYKKQTKKQTKTKK